MLGGSAEAQGGTWHHSLIVWISPEETPPVEPTALPTADNVKHTPLTLQTLLEGNATVLSTNPN